MKHVHINNLLVSDLPLSEISVRLRLLEVFSGYFKHNSREIYKKDSLIITKLKEILQTSSINTAASSNILTVEEIELCLEPVTLKATTSKFILKEMRNFRKN